jgi:hypothetical protein
MTSIHVAGSSAPVRAASVFERQAVDNDGRPDFVTNPFNGPAPTYQQALQRVCDVNRAAFDSWRARNYAGTAPCLFRDFEELAPPDHLANLTNSWQSSFGVQRQFGADMAIEVDYVNNRSRNEKILHDQVNLAYDPATGVVTFKRPDGVTQDVLVNPAMRGFAAARRPGDRVALQLTNAVAASIVETGG